MEIRILRYYIMQSGDKGWGRVNNLALLQGNWEVTVSNLGYEVAFS
jgi:hypothetical protein